MATIAAKRNEARTGPTPAELGERAKSLVPMLRDASPRAEEARRVSAEVMDALRALDLLKLMKPARFGGLAQPPSTLLRVGFELGRGCGSAAWCAMIANANDWYTSYWPLRAQQDVWGVDRDNVVASAALPTGKSEAVEGGYHVWGRWPFASNCDNSQWFVVASALTEADGAPAGAGWFLTPRDTIRIDQESWRVSGLQGTGSKTLFADDPVFVPSHRMIRMGEVMGGAPPGAAVEGNSTAAYQFATFSAVPLAAPLLGMAQGALDWFVEAMRTKVRFAPGPGAPPTAAHNPFIQERAGRASVTIAAALTHLLTELGGAEAKIEGGETLDSIDRGRVRTACTHASRQAVEAVNLLAESAGANSSDTNVPIQRFWRDINAGARHVGLDATATNAAVGQLLFGLDPLGKF